MSMPTPSTDTNSRFVLRVVLKAAILFMVINYLFALTDAVPALGKISAYNHIFPGRARLPYGENPEKSYNLSLFNLDTMFASHELAAGEKPLDEYRVILIGDSSTWGYLLDAGDTLSASLNQAGYTLPDGRRARFYNVGYPVMSLMKDLLILNELQQYEPDLIVWLFTLESFPYDKQLYAPLLQHNPESMRELIEEYQLTLDPNDSNLIQNKPWDHTLIGSRRVLADWLRLQLYGVMWASTGIDQDIPESFTPRLEDLAANDDFHNLQPPHLREEDLALEILHSGVELAGETPLILINEPMFISQGKNSDIRYNFYYPRWAYDDYRRILKEQSKRNNWLYVDLWDAIPTQEFTNTAVHLSPKGNAMLAKKVLPFIQNLINSKK